MASREVNNFGGNVRFTPEAIYDPQSEEEVLAILNQHRGQKIRAKGRLHSWSSATETTGVLLDLRNLNTVTVESENESYWAIVGAGCQIKRLLKELKKQGGLTLPSMGLITEQTIAGAMSTGTHGSGKHSISHYVEAVRVACYDPDSGEAVIRELSTGEELLAARCSLGCLGVILSVKIRCRKQYLVEEHFQAYENLADVLAKEAEYPLQQFFLVPWQWRYLATHRKESTGTKSWLASLYGIYWFLFIDLGLHLLLLFSIRLLNSAKLARFLYRWIIPKFVVKGWKVTGDSASMLVMEHELFRHIEIELFVKASVLEPALNYVKEVLICAAGEGELSQLLSDQMSDLNQLENLQNLAESYCHHYPICVRRILPDDTLISMASGGDESWYAISLISYQGVSHREGFLRVAEFLAKTMAILFAARPHWGKICPLKAEELVGLYDRFDEFQQVCKAINPDGVFRNDWTTQLLNVDLGNSNEVLQ